MSSKSQRGSQRSLKSGAQIRQEFLDFFARKGHTIVPSSSLVPSDDPTLLFTNAGMVQFKDVFLGTGKRPYVRAADSQKCMRVAGKHNDLEDVGRDDTHHTFFEMLGNWSFGDYYKKEAIAWAWELLTEVWGLPKEAIWATCFQDDVGDIPRDDEAAEYWSQQPGFDPSHILFFGRKDNFWEMADTGPSGPCSEIHLDQGPEACEESDNPDHVCGVNQDCLRYLELWNLVFIQYNRLGPTELEPLPDNHVDTGLGLDRIVSVLQNVRSNYETDMFTPIMDCIQELANHTDDERARLLTPYRVVADHGRAAAFLIADGVVPGNTGRNYVCRMIIRRASRFGTKAGFEEPFLAQVAETVIANYGQAYPELERNRKAILTTISDEERRFQRSVDAGITHLVQELEAVRNSDGRILSGGRAFDLYATYGLPLEITRDIARENQMDVDDEGFFKAMEEHRLVSSAGDAFTDRSEVDAKMYWDLLAQLNKERRLPADGVAYDPYHGLAEEGPVLAILQDGEPVQTASPGEEVAIILPKTPFYVEAGGQVSDTGTINSASEPAWEIAIGHVGQPITGAIVHYGKVLSGSPRVGDQAVASVESARRMDIMRNHTATHLLQASLRATLGEHVRQAGSLVAPDRLRFDFTHPSAMSDEELARVENMVNGAILANHVLESETMAHDEAIAQGAIALFGETYGERVRTIRIGGPDSFSFELCGGTHVPETGIIGPFIILSEGSVASGIRRIEAVTGRGAMSMVLSHLTAANRMAKALAVGPEDLEARVYAILEEQAQLDREINGLREQLAVSHYQSLTPETIAGVPVLTGQIPKAGAEVLRRLVDRFRQDYPTGVVVLASSPDDKPVIVAGVSADLVERGLHAGELVKAVAQHVGGGGGGRPTLAQAGGRDASRLPQALDGVTDWVGSHLA